MKLSEVVKTIKKNLPIGLVTGQDNVGLITGNYDDECGTMIVAYELNPGVIEEAVGAGSNLVVTYHTPLFRPTKTFTSSGANPDPLFNATRSGVNVFCVHTSLDVPTNGLNFDLAKRFGLEGIRLLAPLEDTLYKVVVFVPHERVGEVRTAMARNGAGKIGDYSECAYSSEGEGNFVPGEGTSPYVGSPGKLESASESRLEMVVEKSLSGQVVDAMIKAHPYEQVAYDVYPLVNESASYGFGAIGDLPQAISVKSFLAVVKKLLGLQSIRVSHLPDEKVKKVALCAGSGMPFYQQAVHKGADIFITGDVRHHDFRQAQLGPTVLADATHRGTERFAAEVLHGVLREAFENRIVVNLSKHEFDSAVIV